MKKLDYKVDNEEMKGTVKVIVPSQTSTFRVLTSCGIKIKNGKVNTSAIGLDTLDLLTQRLEKHIEDVAIVLSDGTKINSKEELFEDSSCDDLVTELRNCIVGGFNLGEDSSKVSKDK